MTGTGVAGVTVVRAGTPVLQDVALPAVDGELLVVLVASGSGKSTRLRVLAGTRGGRLRPGAVKGPDVS